MLVLSSYYFDIVVDGDIRDFCIHVSADEYYHFRVSEHNACLIDWWYFVREPFTILLMMYAIIIAPFVIVHKYAKMLYK